MLITNKVHTNTDFTTLQFRSFQLSFSTADIEKNVFYGSEFSPVESRPEPERGMMLVVHGDIFTLEDQTVPRFAIPLTEESRLFQFINNIPEQP